MSNFSWENDTARKFTLYYTPPPSEWACYLFGSGSTGIVWRPAKGTHPNRFWRWMQFICFGNRWVKESNDAAVGKV